MHRAVSLFTLVVGLLIPVAYQHRHSVRSLASSKTRQTRSCPA